MTVSQSRAMQLQDRQRERERASSNMEVENKQGCVSLEGDESYRVMDECEA